MSKEMHLPKTPEDRAKWKAMGNYERGWWRFKTNIRMNGPGRFPNRKSPFTYLPSAFFERIIDYGLSKYPERFTIQNCQLTGRREDTGTLSYDLVQKYRDRAHHGFQSLAGFSHGGERMGSIEMAVLNVVHAKGEYWELYGLNAETSAAIASAWEEANKLGYDAYKEKLIAEGRYQEQSGDRHRGKERRGQRNAGLTPEA